MILRLSFSYMTKWVDVFVMSNVFGSFYRSVVISSKLHKLPVYVRMSLVLNTSHCTWGGGKDRGQIVSKS